MLRQYELVEKVRSYDPDADEGLINRAYVFSMQAHGSELRASGDPYFSHPIEVAGISDPPEARRPDIATAILHDTIEDTLATPEQIEKLFGGDVARLVDGATKSARSSPVGERARGGEPCASSAGAQRRHPRAAGEARATGCTTANTPPHPSEEKRRRIARETMDIYAPLAERIGMYEMMNET